MGVVIPFEQIKRSRSPPGSQPPAAENFDERITADAVSAAVVQSEVLAAARQLIDRCRDRYGFVVMREGLPEEPATLGRVLLELSRALAMLEAEMEAPRTYPMFGVYFSRRQLAWFEDGYSGTTALAVHNDIKAVDLAAFVRPRVAVAQSHSRK